MRYDFQWDLPTPNGPAELALCISSMTGWLGLKHLSLNGQTLYRRGIFSGINHPIEIPGAPSARHYMLRAAPTGPDGEWRPTLYAGSEIVPEKLGTPPPHNPRRPLNLAATVGVTYLLIFILFIMWVPIENMLDAAYSQTDSRVFVIKVKDEAPLPDFHQSGNKLPDVKLGEPYSVQLSTEGGVPPLKWHRKSGRIPPGLTLDADSGVISGTPKEAGDFPLTMRAVDAVGKEANYSYVIRVESPHESTPQIVTDNLPDATVGEPYSVTLKAEGGRPPYRWICNSRKLPNGLKLKKTETTDNNSVAPQWEIAGTPTAAGPTSASAKPESVAGPYSIRLRVNDDSYHARRDTKPWFLPIGLTVVCLLGFWSMKRAAVPLFALVILGEAILQYLGVVPISMAAMGFQSLILLVGIANFKHMD